MSDISVRQAVLADLDALAPLFDRYREFQGQASDPAAAHAFLRARFDHGESVVFVAWAGDRPVGFAQLYPSFSSVTLTRVFLLNDLFVDATVRRRGVASRLLAALEAHAWSLDATRVTLFVARPNTTGQALYASRGWQADDAFFVLHRHRSREVDRASGDQTREAVR
jgi:GNAT superfamily N-acetyltransferase